MEVVTGATGVDTVDSMCQVRMEDGSDDTHNNHSCQQNINKYFGNYFIITTFHSNIFGQIYFPSSKLTLDLVKCRMFKKLLSVFIIVTPR